MECEAEVFDAWHRQRAHLEGGTEFENLMGYCPGFAGDAFRPIIEHHMFCAVRVLRVLLRFMPALESLFIKGIEATYVFRTKPHSLKYEARNADSLHKKELYNGNLFNGHVELEDWGILPLKLKRLQLQASQPDRYGLAFPVNRFLRFLLDLEILEVSGGNILRTWDSLVLPYFPTIYPCLRRLHLYDSGINERQLIRLCQTFINLRELLVNYYCSPVDHTHEMVPKGTEPRGPQSDTDHTLNNALLGLVGSLRSLTIVAQANSTDHFLVTDPLGRRYLHCLPSMANLEHLNVDLSCLCGPGSDFNSHWLLMPPPGMTAFPASLQTLTIFLRWSRLENQKAPKN